MPDEDKNKGKVIMEAKIHCDSCKEQVRRAILGYPGVELIESISIHERKVILKAPNVDVKKLFETVKKKSKGKVTKLIYPDPKNLPKKKEEKKEEPKDVTLRFKIHNHCEDCRRKYWDAAWNIKDVFGMELSGDILTLKGKNLDEKKVCEELRKKTKKHVEVAPKKEEKKDEAKSSVTTCAVTTFVAYPPQYFSDENPNACLIM